jgi:hypothetical protein
MLRRIVPTIIVSGLLGSGPALGCVRSPFEPPPICQRFWQDDAVALVEVTDIQERGYNRQVTLRIVDAYRGKPPADLSIKDQRTDCGVTFPSKGRYLTWLSRTKSGEWQAYGDRADRVPDELKYAQSMKNPPQTGRIYGTLDKPRRNLFISAPNLPQRLPDRTEAVVVAENDQGRFSAKVGPELSFDFPALLSGKYKVHVEGLPEKLAVDSQEIEVHGGGCNELTLFSASSASISGRVVSTGSLPHFGQVFLVDLASAENRRGRFARWVLTDGNTGTFEFKHVAPGKYVLGFELGHSPTLGVPYASRYFPSGTDESKATLFEVTAGQEIKDVEFNLGSEVARRHVLVRVTWEDESPAVNATAYLRDAHDPDSSVADEQTPTDSNGKATLEGFVDTDYDVDANAVCKGRLASKQIKKKIIPASSTDAFVELTVKGRKCSLVLKRYALEIE